MLYLERSFCGSEIWTVGDVYQIHMEFLEMWCRRRLQKVSWSDCVRNEEVLHRVKEERIIIHTVRKKKD